MASLDSIPQVTTLSSYIGSSGNSGTPTVKFIPKNPDGTVFDCTGYNTATFNIALQSPQNPNSSSVNQTGTIGTADATGITVHLTNAQINAYLAASKGVTGALPFALFIGNGTNTLLAGVGTLVLNLAP